MFLLGMRNNCVDWKFRRGRLCISFLLVGKRERYAVIETPRPNASTSLASGAFNRDAGMVAPGPDATYSPASGAVVQCSFFPSPAGNTSTRVPANLASLANSSPRFTWSGWRGLAFIIIIHCWSIRGVEGDFLLYNRVPD